ncbi:Protein ECERIFERUM 2 [Linum grandiflorum]
MESNPIPVPKPHLEGILTVMPMAVTEPRRIRRVSYSGEDPVGGSGILTGCLNVVLYYTRSAPDREDSGWVAAGWMKESLARALSEQPLVSGRVRKCEGEETGDGEKLEVVSNDSGARLLEATMPVSLTEFMEMDDKVRAEAEADLVFWKEIDEITPQFSPLFYVQVTNFKCGGYSVGISCSLLVADLLITENFLQRWAQIQQSVVPKFTVGDDDTKMVKQLPIFYLPNLKPNGSFPPEVFSSTPSRGQALTFILKSTQLLDDRHRNDAELIASLGVNEARRKVKKGAIPDQFRMVEVVAGKECPAAGVLEVKTWRKSDEAVDDHVGAWEELRMAEVCFYEGKKSDGLACWVGWPNDDDGFLMAFVDPVDGGDVVLVAIPGGEKQHIY